MSGLDEIPDNIEDQKPICGDCGAPMRLQNSKFGLFWGCTRWPDCNGRHAAHQKTGLPMGTPADEETRQWRKKAHNAFDVYWKKWGLKRPEAYGMLAMAMHLPEEKAHISLFDIAQCKKVIQICNGGLKVEI